MGEVSGWGRTDPDDSYHPIDLQTVSLPQVSLEQCTLAYKFYAVTVDDTQVCAGYLSGGQDACQGDSGGPYWVVDEAGIQRVVGIVSYGIGCAQPGLYGIYTRVNSFNSWIVSYLSGGVQTRADTYVYAAEEDDANRDYSYNPDANDFSRAEASTSDSSVLSVGAIVGIAVGCVAVVGIFVGGAVFVVKRKKQISTPNSNTSAQLRESSVGVRENESSTSVTDVSGRSNDKTLFV
ncbi:hypothetical protein SARC_04962 [Sphaeroforma arctica JP610]|uniref:Peptidase S1 domain-containing protein n=1 Tax=Sphaeroforma arctica JP610 TaxID=667725 RepID=A0A0L0G0X2_9EUKA|nr:hypothetical protein SARC_04962 [Sphaeroforma arctica JP610]KNC82762.1 hypothetical protein SARC_04962 [Sphaeroforma arctica JP610]|eukprot:XP_014156664.1 hypothetical protein SARC_04962 [Sphaeroforma arctica JP610]